MLTAKAAYKSLHLTDIFNFSSVQLRESLVGQAIRDVTKTDIWWRIPYESNFLEDA